MRFLTDNLRKFIVSMMKTDRTFVIDRNGKKYHYIYYFDKDYRVIARNVYITIQPGEHLIPGFWKMYMMPEQKKSTYKVE